MVVKLVERFGDGIIIHVIDPQSLRGVVKSLRHRVRRYPSFIVDGQERIVGWNQAALFRAIETRSAGQLRN